MSQEKKIFKFDDYLKEQEDFDQNREFSSDSDDTGEDDQNLKNEIDKADATFEISNSIKDDFFEYLAGFRDEIEPSNVEEGEETTTVSFSNITHLQENWIELIIDSIKSE